MIEWFGQQNHILQAMLAHAVHLVRDRAGRQPGVRVQDHQPAGAGRHAGFCRGRHDRRQLLVAAGAGHRDGFRGPAAQLAAGGGRFPAGRRIPVGRG